MSPPAVSVIPTVQLVNGRGKKEDEWGGGGGTKVGLKLSLSERLLLMI